MSSTSTIVLITGANSGIGYATAKVLADASTNYHIILSGRNTSSLATAIADLQASSIKASLSTLHLDVTNASSVQAAAHEVEKTHGRLDVLINNAGIADQTLPEGTDLKTRLDTTLTTNVTGPAIVSEAFTPLLKKSQNAYSIYVSSGLASLTNAADPSTMYYQSDYTVYRLSKTALNMWALQESKKLQKEGIKVFIMCPGLVRSNLRGKDETMVSAGGNAGDPAVSGQTILRIVEGKREEDVGKYIHKDGVYPW